MRATGKPRSRIRRSLVASIVGWVIVGLPVVALLLRFGMRALGVRTDVPFPGMIYSATAPLVEPFYPVLPANMRFDTAVVEAASLAAAGAVFLAAVLAYLLAFLIISIVQSEDAQE